MVVFLVCCGFEGLGGREVMLRGREMFGMWGMLGIGVFCVVLGGWCVLCVWLFCRYVGMRGGFWMVGMLVGGV